MPKHFYQEKWDDESCELLTKKRMRKNHRLSRWFGKFNIRDAFTYGSHIDSYNYGVSKQQYNANYDYDLIDGDSERVKGE